MGKALAASVILIVLAHVFIWTHKDSIAQNWGKGENVEKVVPAKITMSEAAEVTPQPEGIKVIDIERVDFKWMNFVARSTAGST